MSIFLTGSESFIGRALLDLEVVRDICRQSGACEALEAEIDRYGRKAALALPATGFSPEVTDAFERFIHTSIYRDA